MGSHWEWKLAETYWFKTIRPSPYADLLLMRRHVFVYWGWDVSCPTRELLVAGSW